MDEDQQMSAASPAAELTGQAVTTNTSKGMSQDSCLKQQAWRCVSLQVAFVLTDAGSTRTCVTPSARTETDVTFCSHICGCSDAYVSWSPSPGKMHCSVRCQWMHALQARHYRPMSKRPLQPNLPARNQTLHSYGIV